MHDYKKLEVWSRSMNLVEEVYSISSKLPEEEKLLLVRLKFVEEGVVADILKNLEVVGKMVHSLHKSMK